MWGLGSHLQISIHHWPLLICLPSLSSTSLQPLLLLLMLISISRYHAMVWCYGEG